MITRITWIAEPREAEAIRRARSRKKGKEAIGLSYENLIDPFFLLKTTQNNSEKKKEEEKETKRVPLQDSNPTTSARAIYPYHYTTEETSQVVAKVFNLIPFP